MFKLFTFLKGLFNTPDLDTCALVEEQWNADFSSERKARFQIENQEAYASSLSGGLLRLALKKGDCLAWIEDSFYRYSNLVAEVEISFAPGSGYAASGILFRYVDTSSYYSLLVSTHGYFRLDAVFNGSPLPLIGWTEIPARTEVLTSFKLRVIALGDRLTVVIDDAWAGEVMDSTLREGRVALALASYEVSALPSVSISRFSLESRPVDIEAINLRWNTLIKVQRSSRSHLAETFEAMGQPLSALVQIRRITKAGEELNQAELLLAARSALSLGLLPEAENYLETCIRIAPESPDAGKAMAERARLLYLANRFEELKAHSEKALPLFPDDTTLITLHAHALFNLGQYNEAALEYEKALQKESSNGILAQNAANALTKAGKIREAAELYLTAGSAFLAAENYGDLELVLPLIENQLARDYRFHALKLKYAFALENWAEAEKELSISKALSPDETSPDYDTAVPYLEALLLNRKGKRKEALGLLESIVKISPDYLPYRIRLVETRFLLSGNPNDKKLLKELDEALKLGGDDAWLFNLAAQIALARGEIEQGRVWLEKAAALLPDETSVLVNRAEFAFLSGRKEEALRLLPEGAAETNAELANARGNLLVRLNRFEEADKAYQRAVKLARDNPEYLRNRAACLIELSRFGEADELLSRAFDLDNSCRTLELTAYVAAKKGELPRAEAACRLGLELDPEDKPLLSSLAWAYLGLSRWEAADEIISRLENLSAGEEAWEESARELREHLLEATTRTIACATCDCTWRVLKLPPDVGVLRLVAEPPDEMPAGTCPTCLKTFCIACGKKNLMNGRFICPTCRTPLKLLDHGLKKLLADWADQHQA